MSKDNIKSYQSQLFLFLVGNLIIMGLDRYLITRLSFNLDSFLKIIPFSAMTFICSYVLNGILSSELKYKIVFLRWKNPLPASRLKETIQSDSRFTLGQLINKFGPIPEDPKEQNVFWYQKIYKPVQGEEKVIANHTSFLLTRDLTSVSVILILASIGSVTFLNSSIWLILLTIAEFLLFRLSAANYGRRLVCTAIADSIE